MKTFVFPGQGSQKKGMGETLFDYYSQFTQKADEILGYSVKTLCLEDPSEQLGQTQFTQPAIYTVNCFLYLKKIEETGIKPNFVAGHSLGEYNALFAAGVFDFQTGLKLVKKRGELMSRATDGGMAAVIGLSPEKINDVIQENDFKNISIANYNTPSQIVLAGSKPEIEQAIPVFKNAGARLCKLLNVSGAFHTQYMQPAKEKFDDYLASFEFSELTIPVISNVDAQPYEQNRIKENLVRQITSSVKWTESICYLMNQGDMAFEEIGPGKVLTGLIRNIKKEI